MKKKKKKNRTPSPKLLRKNRISFMLNEYEIKTIDRYLKKHKIINRSAWIRETIMKHTIKIMIEKDYPTLFGEDEMKG